MSALLALTLTVQILRGGEPVANVPVNLERDDSRVVERGETDARGVVRFLGVEPGPHRLLAGSLQWNLDLTSEMEILSLDLDGPSVYAGRFGREAITHAELERLPHAGTISTVLETLDPFAITQRIDVAGIESGTPPLWSVRGSSWTQNRILVDGLDVTDPSGGASLLYPDVLFFEETMLRTCANPVDAAGPGAELQLVTRSPPAAVSGSFAFRYTGIGLQSENLGEELISFGVEPREMLRFPSARLELGGPRFYAAMNGFDLSTRLPHFEPEEETSLVGAGGKLSGEGWSVLGIAQRLKSPTFGARPWTEASAVLPASETFQVGQASFDGKLMAFRIGFARGDFDSSYSGGGSPVRDLATSAIGEAPLVVSNRTRTRFTAAGFLDWTPSNHAIRAGFEISHAKENREESVPGARERLTVDGVPHAVSFFSGGAEQQASASRLAFRVEDAYFFDFLGLATRLAPGLRLDFSRSGPIRWESLSGTLSGATRLTPSSEIHYSLGRYPHVLTTRPLMAKQSHSWVRRRWHDEDGDGDLSAGEVGNALRRGGGEYTSIAEDLPRPYTHELTVGVLKRFRRGFLRFSGYQRWEKRLLQTVNVGIAPSSYDTFGFLDVGVDGVLGTDDDRELPIFDQVSQLAEDRLLIESPTGLDSSAQGADLLVGFDHGPLSWRLSGRAYRDVGRGNVGNEPDENDTGILGDLFDDPNTLTNSEGRLYFDRAFTGKLALTARAPGSFDVGAAIRYWDGQPFARQVFFENLGQGFVVVQAFPRGRLRYAFNMTVDVRVARELPLGRRRLLLALDAFNLFNQTLQTGENVRSGEDFRDPTFVQPARTLVLEGRLRF